MKKRIAYLIAFFAMVLGLFSYTETIVHAV